MTELRTRLRMAWAVLRGRSVMYRWHSTSTGMIPKTLGAIAVENTGQPAITTEQVKSAGSERREPAAEGSPPQVLDVRGDAADQPSPRQPTDQAMPQPQGSDRRTNG